MPRAFINTERILPYAPDDLCRLVGDVRAYPNFVPWLKSVKIKSEAPLSGGGWEGVADAVVGWKAITERFASRVRCAPDEGIVDVALVNGPFRTLENKWRFYRQDKGARVTFHLAYEFKNPILQGLAAAARDKASAKIMDAFEKEARARFGG